MSVEPIGEYLDALPSRPGLRKLRALVGGGGCGGDGGDGGGGSGGFSASRSLFSLDFDVRALFVAASPHL